MEISKLYTIWIQILKLYINWIEILRENMIYSNTQDIERKILTGILILFFLVFWIGESSRVNASSEPEALTMTLEQFNIYASDLKDAKIHTAVRVSGKKEIK